MRRLAPLVLTAALAAAFSPSSSAFGPRPPLSCWVEAREAQPSDIESLLAELPEQAVVTDFAKHVRFSRCGERLVFTDVPSIDGVLLEYSGSTDLNVVRLTSSDETMYDSGFAVSLDQTPFWAETLPEEKRRAYDALIETAQRVHRGRFWQATSEEAFHRLRLLADIGVTRYGEHLAVTDGQPSGDAFLLRRVENGYELTIRLAAPSGNEPHLEELYYGDAVEGDSRSLAFRYVTDSDFGTFVYAPLPLTEVPEELLDRKGLWGMRVIDYLRAHEAHSAPLEEFPGVAPLVDPPLDDLCSSAVSTPAP